MSAFKERERHGIGQKNTAEFQCLTARKLPFIHFINLKPILITQPEHSEVSDAHTSTHCTARCNAGLMAQEIEALLRSHKRGRGQKGFH